jgi:GntR family transcriptional regulator/MocR family aminotransferase
VVIKELAVPDHRAVVRASGLALVSVPLDDGGMRTDVLASLRVDAVVATPAHQFPLGGTLPPERRPALVRWARA